MNQKIVLFTLFCAATVHGKPALLTAKNSTHAFLLSEEAVACSGNVLQTLINGDESDMPTISLDAIEADAEQEAHQDLMLFAQHLELVADAKKAHPGATDDALRTWLAPDVQKLPLPSLARLFKHADFYGVLPLLPTLEQELVKKIDQDHASLTAQLAAANTPSWLADLLGNARNRILTQKIMHYRPNLFPTVLKKTHVLKGNSRSWAQTLLTPHNTVLTAEFSPDGTKIVTASEDGTAHVWQQDERNEWVPIATLRGGHIHYVRSAQFSPDGTRIVTASDDRTARVWQQGEDGPWHWVEVAVLHGHTGPLFSARFNNDGTKIVTASYDHTARVWQQPDNRPWHWVEVALLHNHLAAVNSARFSPDGTKIVTASEDGTARVWQQTRHNQWRIILNMHNQWFVSQVLAIKLGWGQRHAYDAQFSPDGTKIVVASNHKAAFVWQQNQHGMWEFSGKLAGHSNEVKSAQFSPDGTTILTTSDDHTIRIWQQNNYQRWRWINVTTLQGSHNHWFTGAQFSPDGTKIVTTSRTDPMVWDVFDVIGNNKKAGLVLTLKDVLPALQKVDPANTSFLRNFFGKSTRKKINLSPADCNN